MLRNHITEADYQKLLKVKENAGNVKEKVGYSKPPIKLPDNFSEVIGGIEVNWDAEKMQQFLLKEKEKKDAETKKRRVKIFISLILLVAVVILFYSFNPKKTA